LKREGCQNILSENSPVKQVATLKCRMQLT
jgi:hypothetical protein